MPQPGSDFAKGEGPAIRGWNDHPQWQPVPSGSGTQDQRRDASPAGAHRYRGCIRGSRRLHEQDRHPGLGGRSGFSTGPEERWPHRCSRDAGVRQSVDTGQAAQARCRGHGAHLGCANERNQLRHRGASRHSGISSRRAVGVRTDWRPNSPERTRAHTRLVDS